MKASNKKMPDKNIHTGAINGSEDEHSESEIPMIKPGNRSLSSAESDPEVLERPMRRRFSAETKLRILKEAAACKHGELGALLRREGIVSSHLKAWREQQKEGELKGLSPKSGPEAIKPTVALRLKAIEKENRHLKKRLARAEGIIEIQKKISEILGIPMNQGESEGSE